MSDVTIIDSGGANLASLQFALQRLGASAAVSSDPDTVRRAGCLILPGVGAAPDAMQRLRAAGLIDVLRQATQPLLGICLGMQLLYAESTENPEAPDTPVACLNVLPQRVSRMAPGAGHPVPHMGWNQLAAIAPRNALLQEVASGAYVYFVHSYAAPVTAATVARCDYGGEFCAMVQQDNFFGMQFHPERSGATGARLLANFLSLSA